MSPEPSRKVSKITCLKVQFASLLHFLNIQRQEGPLGPEGRLKVHASLFAALEEPKNSCIANSSTTIILYNYKLILIPRQQNSK